MANYICECDYKPRLVAPSYSNKYYIKTTYGGYNKAELINKKTGSVLPDCTGAAHGLFLEAAKNTNPACDNLHTGDAKNYWYKNDGYERGQTPRVGAIACWEMPGERYGHIGTVVEIKNGSIHSAMSELDGVRWYYRLIPKKNGTYDYSTKKYNWHFLGFIYNPYILVPIGTAKVKTNNLRIRRLPSTRSKIMGYVENGKTYKVYEIKKNQGYNWYRIGTEKWIADNGKWLTYKVI